jgi:hypothetical protein
MQENTIYAEMLQAMRAQRRQQEAKIRQEEAWLRTMDETIAGLAMLAGEAPPAAETQTSESGSDLSGSHEITVADSQKMTPAVLKATCYGKNIADAAIAVLAVWGKPLSEIGLLDYLKIGGTAFASSDPRDSLRNVLVKEQRETGVVVELSARVWGLKSWPELNPNHLGFVAYRDKESHMAASMEGLRRARELGKKLGKPEQITEKDAPVIREMLAQGARQQDVAARLKVTRSGLLKAMMRLESHGIEVRPNRRLLTTPVEDLILERHEERESDSE